MPTAPSACRSRPSRTPDRAAPPLPGAEAPATASAAPASSTRPRPPSDNGVPSAPTGTTSSCQPGPVQWPASLTSDGNAPHAPSTRPPPQSVDNHLTRHRWDRVPRYSPERPPFRVPDTRAARHDHRGAARVPDARQGRAQGSGPRGTRSRAAAASRLGQPFTAENVDRSPYDGGITAWAALHRGKRGPEPTRRRNHAFVRDRVFRKHRFRAQPRGRGGAHDSRPYLPPPRQRGRPAPPHTDMGGPLHRQPASARAGLRQGWVARPRRAPTGQREGRPVPPRWTGERAHPAPDTMSRARKSLMSFNSTGAQPGCDVPGMRLGKPPSRNRGRA